MKQSAAAKALDVLIDKMREVERNKMSAFKKRSKEDLEDEESEEEDED